MKHFISENRDFFGLYIGNYKQFTKETKPMMMSTFRNLSVDKMTKVVQREYFEIMESKEDYNLGLRRIDHHFRHCCKKVNVYRHGRKNALYSK